MLWHEPDRAHEVFHHSLPTSAGVPLTVAPAIADFPGFLTKERPTMNLTRLLILPLAILLTLGLAGVASGVATSTVTSKTINVTNGECVNPGNPPTLADGVTPCNFQSAVSPTCTAKIAGCAMVVSSMRDVF